MPKPIVSLRDEYRQKVTDLLALAERTIDCDPAKANNAIQRARQYIEMIRDYDSRKAIREGM